MIRFNVIGQTLKRTDEFTPASDSVEFLKAQFNIVSDEWDGYALTALFRHYETGVTYRAVCDFNGVCVVPWEALTKPAKSRLNPKYCRFYVTLTGNKGASVATTNEFEVEMRISGYTEGEEPAEPTPDAYAQYVEVVKAEADRVETAAADVKSAAQTVEKSVETAENIAESNEETAGIIKNSAANAFKGVASGEVVRVDDVSPIEHIANVWVHGKNLFHFTETKTGDISGVAYSVEPNSSVITLNGTATKNNNALIRQNIVLQKGTYTISVKGANVIDSEYDRVYVYDVENDAVITNYVKDERPRTFILTRDTIINICYLVGVGSTYQNTNVYIQIELGNTATEYTPYIDPSTVTVTEETTGATYTPNADGTCEIVSVSPTMTLLTDTEGITIECEYNRDTNIVMGDIETAIDGILAIQNAIIGGDYS